MFKKIINKFNPTIENLEKELLSQNFNQSDLESFLTSKKISLDELNSKGETLLHICLRADKNKEAKWLIEKGIDTSIKDNNGVSIAQLVIKKDNKYILDTLIENNKLDLDWSDENGRSLLQDAILEGHEDMVKYLLNKDIDLNHTDRHNRNVAFDAINSGKSKLIEDILSHESINLNMVDKTGKTVLHNQNVLDDDDLAIKLLEKGADPTICDRSGKSFLEVAALRGEAGEAILDTAIRYGCDLNTKVANNNSILMEVMFAFSKIPKAEEIRRQGLKSVAKKLLDNGLDPKAVNNDGENSLFNCVRAGDVEGCAFLLEHDANVNQKNNKGETALYLAILKGVQNLNIIILLLEYGADPLIRNNDGFSIYEILNDIILHVHNRKILTDKKIIDHIHSAGNYMLILKEILSKNEDLDIVDSKGDPIFFTPFIYDDKETTKLYLKFGFDINQKNRAGHTLFYEYTLKVFNRGEYFNEFRENLVFLLVNNADVHVKNKEGQNIYMKVALIKECQPQLFRKLIEVTKHNYEDIDNLGRTIIHSCVWSNNIKLLNIVYGVERNIQNIPDRYNILPVTYAALLGNQDMVIEFLRRGAVIRSRKAMTPEAKKKFAPFLKNLDRLTIDVESKDDIQKIEILIDEIKRSFKL